MSANSCLVDQKLVDCKQAFMNKTSSREICFVIEIFLDKLFGNNNVIVFEFTTVRLTKT